MICRKCGHQWLREPDLVGMRYVPPPKDINCPNCGAAYFKDGLFVVRCRICGRILTNPKSIARGVGPVCWAAVKRRETHGDD